MTQEELLSIVSNFAIEGKAELTIKPEEGMRVMKVMEAAFLSHETQSAVKTEI